MVQWLAGWESGWRFGTVFLDTAGFFVFVGLAFGVVMGMNESVRMRADKTFHQAMKLVKLDGS